MKRHLANLRAVVKLDNESTGEGDVLNRLCTSNKLMFTEKNRGNVYDFYILGTIEEAEEYTEWFDTIRNATPNDIIRIHFNSFGGDLFTAIQFLAVIRECQGMIVGMVEGACMSAATIIFLACDTYIVSPHSSFMIHNYSGGTCGKGGEMISQIEYEKHWATTLMSETYENFLSSEEIKMVMDGRDIWLSADQLVARLNKRFAIQKAKKKKTATTSKNA